MINLIMLTCVTVLSVWLQRKIILCTRNYVLLLPVLAIYYWSMLGGWVVTIDLLSGNALEQVGFHYYAYFNKLFPIRLDDAYVKSLCWFSLFLLTFQAALFGVVKRFGVVTRIKEDAPIFIDHRILIAGAFGLAALSYFFIRAQIMEAIDHQESLYLYLSHQSGRFYSLYQITKSGSLFLILFGVSLLLSQCSGRHFTGNYSPAIAVGYVVAVLVLFIYATLIGSRSDLLFAFLFAIVFYLINARKISVYRVGGQVVGLVLVVAVIEMTRAIPILAYLGLSTGPGIPTDEVVSRMSFFSTLLNLMASNEMFAGHMSMYGAVYYDVPLTWGGSFNYLLHSMIPRFMIIERPPDSYQHYAAAIHYTGAQGFTINHATGWYVNFGVAGVVVGGALLGSLVGAGHVLQQRACGSSVLRRIFRVLLLLTVCAFFPSLIRTGPEGFKALCFEAVIIPVVLIFGVYFISNHILRRGNNTL